MFDFFTRAEMYPWMAELKKGADLSRFHEGLGHNFEKPEGFQGIKRDLIMANWPAIGSLILPNIGGWVSGAYFAGQIRKKTPGEVSWYDELKKPSWTPPKWVFGPAWTVLYTGMGYASYRVWEECGGFNESSVVPLSLYGTQLALNWAWTPIFFGLRDFKLAFIEISVLSATAVATTISFAQYDRTAALLLLPYLAWLGYASSLSYYIYKNNPKDEKKN